MLHLLLNIILLQLAGSLWIAVETHDISPSVYFSPIPNDDTVTSTYAITILEEEVPRPLSEIDAFKVEITLESGYTITRVLHEWELEEVEDSSGIGTQKAIALEVVIEGWDHWELEIFKVEAWCRLKGKGEEEL